MTLILERAQLDAIARQVSAEFPAEACGLLTGKRTLRTHRVTRLWPAANLLAHLPDRFELDPGVRLLAEKLCRANGEEVLGHWHSHPGGPPLPSATDLAMAYEPNLVWLILGVAAGTVTGTLAWRLTRGSKGFRPVRMKLIEDDRTR